MNIQVKRYNSKFKSEWDDFNEKANNSTFLFKRDFIEYHGSKIVDFSLMIFANNHLVALLPANLEDEVTVTSHSGLTYGGFVVLEDVKLNLYLIIFKSALKFLNEKNIILLNYKAIPIFYTSLHTQEEEYALFLVKAKNYRTDTSLTIKYPNTIPFQTRRLRSIKKSKKYNLVIKEDNNFKLFWKNILTPRLDEKYDKKPTHTLKEIEYLASKFPNNIKQFNIVKDNEIVAGCTIFETSLVAHAQYISSNTIGRKLGAIDKLFQFLILDKFKDKYFFDFGICNENDGYVINHGLLDWKEGFGGRTFVNKFYSIRTSNFQLLNNTIKKNQ
ncbi:MAG: GNAT family N-acetyltransferase [Flavobacteriaceae bacterium]|nr:GNAT family N-acetyltransferase [Flavobacteriaceae bacterium]